MVVTDGEIKLQHLFHQLQLGDGNPGTSVFVVIALPSPDRASLLSLCFLEEVTTNGVVIKLAEMIDGVIIHDEWRYEMDMMGMSQITIIVQPEPASPFDLFRVFTSEVTEEIQTIPILDFLEEDGSLFEDIVSHVEGASNLVDPSLSFNVLSRFISRFNDVSIASFMDLSIFKYSSVSFDSISIFTTHSPTPQIFDIDDEIEQHDSERNSFDHASDPIDERVSPAIVDV